MAEVDHDLIDAIAEHLELSSGERETFEETITLLISSENEAAWQKTLRKLAKNKRLKSAVLGYFKLNPLSKDDIAWDRH